MNSIVNNETDLLCYRLRTERQRKRAARKGFERKLRSFEREENKLYDQQKELGWVDLTPPVMRGWKRFYVLRADIARSKDAAFFQGLLDKINTVDYSSRKDFKVKYRSQGKKLHYVKEQRLKYWHEAKYFKAIFSDKELQFFEERDVPDWTGKKFNKAFIFTEPWRFVLQVKPNIITQTRVRDEVIESRLCEIDNYFERNHLRVRLKNIKGVKDYWYSDMQEERWRKERHQFKNIPLIKLLEVVKQEHF